MDRSARLLKMRVHLGSLKADVRVVVFQRLQEDSGRFCARGATPRRLVSAACHTGAANGNGANRNEKQMLAHREKFRFGYKRFSAEHQDSFMAVQHAVRQKTSD